MPARRADSRAALSRTLDANLCKRCQGNPPDITVRGELLCKECFFRYVSTKVVKRMESFRVRNSQPGAERTLLLPISLGSCSLSLLHCLNSQLVRQNERTGRPGFKLHVLHVSDTESTAHLDKVKALFPDHVYSVIPLSDVSQLHYVTSIFSDQDRPTDLSGLLESLKSATSRTDISQILLRKLIVHFAQSHGCEAILWGDSTTRLAERTLAETAKGRGSSLPWIMTDGRSFQGITFYYPMRDLLTKETLSYLSLLQPPLIDLVVKDEVKPAVSTKNATIDDLMRQYFRGIERDFPSIVANVVRTASKLDSSLLDHAEAHCELCDMPLDGQSPENSRICYGCIRTLP
ncbi:Hypothetical protein R9X50_00260700 [Acrodontium crateriforme]|uniref:Cytoplasmic tRNA 2-thiolation protein 2 n=1 Tax=Acrodontium crateriforme TaxID=150365 RepID=A0AAQ3R6T6_9PEZI|nr:Hypothetical protein R9X50_00260700 [Acrodontium crateriforme]